MSDTSISTASTAGAGASKPKRLFRRGPWENASTAIIGLGIVMLMQPFSMTLFSYSVSVILLGTVSFIITSHFSE
jgi:hypothetical protein